MIQPDLTADSILLTAQRLGLKLVPRGRYFDLETMCACPAGVAAIMWDPHLAKGSFGITEAIKTLDIVKVSGLTFGFDLGDVRVPLNGTDEFKAYTEVGAEIRRRVEADNA